MVATRSARRAAASQKSQISRAKVVFAVLAAVAFQLLLTSLDLPLLKVGRNLVASTMAERPQLAGICQEKLCQGRLMRFLRRCRRSCCPLALADASEDFVNG